MNAKTHLTAALILGAVLCASGTATIVEIYGDSSLPGMEQPRWVFDYELQTLTRTGNVHLLPGTSDHLGAYYEPWGYSLRCADASVGIIRGVANSDSIFRMTASYENETDMPWTAWLIQWRALFAGGSIPLEDVVYTGGSKLTTAIYDIGSYAEPGMILTGNPVLPGEVFTFNLDVYVGEGGFYDRLGMAPIVPEPATALLLALGAAGLLPREPNLRAKYSNTSR